MKFLMEMAKKSKTSLKDYVEQICISGKEPEVSFRMLSSQQ